MPIFKYTAADKAGKIQTGQMEAVDRQAVIDYLKDEDLLVVSVSAPPSALSGSVWGNRISVLDKINFTGNLAIMLKAGVSMPEALQVIGDDSRSLYFRRVMADIRFGLENGKSLSEGLANFKKDFNEVFINLIRAGEASGKLEESLAQLHTQLKKEYGLISRVKSALSYPAVLIGGVILVAILLMTFVLPRLVTLFTASNLKLPFSTRLVFAISRALSFKPILTISVIVIAVIVLFFLLRTRTFTRFLSRILARLPVAKQLMEQIELVRFSRTLGNLLQSGVAIIPSLEITANAMNLPAFRHATLNAKEAVAKGVSLNNAFRQEKHFPVMLISVIKVGEKTGELDGLLLNLADFYEEQADNTLKSLASLIEPILLVVVGLTIGGMALSIILPVYQLIGSF